MSADGVAIYEVARACDVSSNAVRRWRRRFEEEGVDGVGAIAPGRGRNSWLPEGTVAEIVAVTMNGSEVDCSKPAIAAWRRPIWEL